jgi:hypothetical protein
VRPPLQPWPCRSPTLSPHSGLPPGLRSKLARTPRRPTSRSLPDRSASRLPHRDPRPRRGRRGDGGGRAGLGRGVLHGHPTHRPPSRGGQRRAPARGQLGCRSRSPPALPSGRGGQRPRRAALQPARLPAVPPLSLPRGDVLIGPDFDGVSQSVVSEAVLDLGLDGPAHGCRPWRLPAERGRRPPTGPALNS